MKLNLRNLYTIFAQHPEGGWIMQQENASEFYNWLKEQNGIKKVLDLGTGIGSSIAIIALVMQEKGITDYKIDTVDQFEKCIKLAKALIPQELQTNIEFHHSRAVASQVSGIPCQWFSIYERIPDISDYDLIINDGPSPWLENGKYIDIPNGTVHKMLLDGLIKPGCKIVYDGRIQSLGLLERYFAKNFYLIHTPKLSGRFNVLERKEGEITIQDQRFEQMKRSTYFKDTPYEKDIVSSHQQSASGQTEAAAGGAEKT